MSDMSVDEFIDLTAERIGRDRAASIAYHTAYAKALTIGLSDDQAKKSADIAEAQVYMVWEIEGDK